MQEYCEDTIYCRRKVFRERFTEHSVSSNIRCNGMCDNCKAHVGIARRSFALHNPATEFGEESRRYGNPAGKKKQNNTTTAVTSKDAKMENKMLKSTFQKAFDLYMEDEFDIADDFQQPTSTKPTLMLAPKQTGKLGLGHIPEDTSSDQRDILNNKSIFSSAKSLMTTKLSNTVKQEFKRKAATTSGSSNTTYISLSEDDDNADAWDIEVTRPKKKPSPVPMRSGIVKNTGVMEDNHNDYLDAILNTSSKHNNNNVQQGNGKISSLSFSTAAKYMPSSSSSSSLQYQTIDTTTNDIDMSEENPNFVRTSSSSAVVVPPRMNYYAQSAALLQRKKNVPYATSSSSLTTTVGNVSSSLVASSNHRNPIQTSASTLLPSKTVSSHKPAVIDLLEDDGGEWMETKKKSLTSSSFSGGKKLLR